MQTSGPWDPWLPVVKNSRLFAQRTVRPLKAGGGYRRVQAQNSGGAPLISFKRCSRFITITANQLFVWSCRLHSAAAGGGDQW